MKQIIAVEGLVCCGKGALCRRFAQETEFVYINAGLIFRGVAWLFEKQIISEIDDIFPFLSSGKVIYAWESEEDTVFAVNAFDKSHELLTLEIGEKASQLAAQQKSFLSLAKVVQTIASDYDKIICDGRGVGSIIFPEANYRFYVTADTQIRARRRFIDLNNQGISVSFKDVMKDIRRRDERDKNREFCPLHPHPLATILHTDATSIEENVALMITKVFVENANIRR